MNSKTHTQIPSPQLGPGVFAFDSHCHLDMTDFDDCRDVIARANAAGVRYILTVGIDARSSRQALAIAEKFPGIYCAIGIHPHHVLEASGADYQELAMLARHPKVVGYGEIGLDYARDYAPKDAQVNHFSRQVELAQKLSLPLIVHDREAHDDVMKILNDAAPFPAGGVMHCYSGDVALASEVMKLGFYLSLPGVVTFSKADTMQEVASTIPLESLLVETDGPYLAPVPFRGKRNEPKLMLYTIAKIAELRGVSLDEVAQITTRNAMKLFRVEDEQ